LAKKRYDLACLYIGLPGMDGLPVLEKIRSVERAWALHGEARQGV